MKKNRIYLIIIIILLFEIVTFMFSNSLEPVAKSKAKSLFVMECVAPILELFVGKGNVTDHLVRKIAHFIEYLSLGVGLMLFEVIKSRLHFQNIANCLSIGLAVAVADESLQMLTDRGPMVKDVLLDFSGVLTGVLVVLLIYTAVKLARRREKLKSIS